MSVTTASSKLRTGRVAAPTTPHAPSQPHRRLIPRPFANPLLHTPQNSRVARRSIGEAGSAGSADRTVTVHRVRSGRRHRHPKRTTPPHDAKFCRAIKLQLRQLNAPVRDPAMSVEYGEIQERGLVWRRSPRSSQLASSACMIFALTACFEYQSVPLSVRLRVNKADIDPYMSTDIQASPRAKGMQRLAGPQMQASMTTCISTSEFDCGITSVQPI